MEFENAYDPERFGAAGRAAVEVLTRHLERARSGEVPVLEPVEPEVLRAELDVPFEAEPDGTGIAGLIEGVLARSVRVHHPRYVGHQMAAPAPEAAVLEMVNALLNNGMGVYEMGQIQTVMEGRVVHLLASRLGLGERAGGIFTHGGSLGNLTALLAARQAKAGYDVWGVGQREPMAVLVSEQAHYCVARAASIMGWGDGGACRVRTDADFRMDVDDLPRVLREARGDGRQVIGVVASACSTATGSFDPLGPVADFCEQHDLWFHVDGAHGAALAMSERHRGKLTGIERADSVVQDLHKMMGMPALNTAVLFREGRRAYEAFAQEAGYLFRSDDAEEEWYDLGHRTLECTKRGMGMTAYCMLKLLGTAWFGHNVDILVGLTRELHDMLRAAPDFETATTPEANILCFRHRPEGLTSIDLGGLQERVRRTLVARGEFYLVQTRLAGAVWLRVALMNPGTTTADLARLLEAIRSAARGDRAP